MRDSKGNAHARTEQQRREKKLLKRLAKEARKRQRRAISELILRSREQQ